MDDDNYVEADDEIDLNNYKGIFYDEPDQHYQDEITGAHFEYVDMCRRLIKLQQKINTPKDPSQTNLKRECSQDTYKVLPFDKGKNGDQGLKYGTIKMNHSSKDAAKIMQKYYSFIKPTMKLAIKPTRENKPSGNVLNSMIINKSIKQHCV